MRSLWRKVLDWRTTATIWAFLVVFCMAYGMGASAGRHGRLSTLQGWLLITVGAWIFLFLHFHAISGDED